MYKEIIQKLENFIKGNNFTSKQIQKITHGYNAFLNDPFKKDASGEYIGYKFDEKSILALLPSTGTAFAISSDGYLVTNYHVVSNADSLFVKGIGGDFNKKYSAKVVATDRNNDLVIIKLNDNLSKIIGKVPFVINSSIADVGENVFVLGYPLTNTMGTEIKLTNGIISSKSGYMDDLTSYQISVPVQPGNSGGPLFDKRGNLIGIVNAKHAGAENVTYAIKSIYLLNLIGLLPKKPNLGTKNILGSKTLSEQNKKLEKVVYLIETN